MMPTALLQAYAVMMPRLRASEALMNSTVVAVGSGRLRKGRAGAIQREWQRQSRTPGSGIVRPRSAGQYEALMRRVGLPVVRSGGAGPGPSDEP